MGQSDFEERGQIAKDKGLCNDLLFLTRDCFFNIYAFKYFRNDIKIKRDKKMVENKEVYILFGEIENLLKRKVICKR